MTLSVLATAVLSLIIVFVLHFALHFRIAFCNKSSRSASSSVVVRPRAVTPPSPHSPDAIASRTSPSSNPTYASATKRTQCCRLHFVDDEPLNFFPVSFLLYMIAHILLGCVLIVRILTTPDDYALPKLFPTHSYAFDSRESLHSSSIFDRVLTYFVMILSIWHCSFSFYQYSTTVTSAAARDGAISSRTIIMRFSLYAALFSTLFAIDVEFYFWLFPAVLSLHCVFDGYCTMKFLSVLIKQFKFFLESSDTISPQHHENVGVLHTIYLVRRVSLLACLLEALSLVVLLTVYSADVIFYLPLLYSIKCLFFAYNFVRNRTFIQLSARRICRCKKHALDAKKKCASMSAIIVNHSSITGLEPNLKATERAQNNLSQPLPTFSPTHSNPVSSRQKEPSNVEDDVPKLPPPDAPVSKSAHCVSNSMNQLVVVNGEKSLRTSFRESAGASLEYNRDLFGVARIRSLDNLSFQFDIEDSDEEDNADNKSGANAATSVAKHELGGIRHTRSNSLPIEVVQAPDDVINSFRMLSIYGFAMRTSKTTSR